MTTRNITDTRALSAAATPPVRPPANHWSTATAAARSQRELVQLSLRLCPGVAASTGAAHG